MVWLRISCFVTIAGLVLASYAVQLGQLNSQSLQKHTANFVTVRLHYCLASDPVASKAKSSSGPTFSARVATQSPFGSTGLLIGSMNASTFGSLHGSKGDCYRGEVRLSPGFEGSRIFFIAKLIGKPTLVSRAGPDAANWLKQRFLANLKGVSPDATGLVAGLSIGDTSKLSPELLADFKVLSLTHLTAVSGTNCAIVLGLLWYLIGRIRVGRFVVTRWPKLAIAGCALYAYLALVGFQPSVLRAGTMALSVIAGKTLGRKTSALGALALGCGLLLVIDPWLLFDYGFLLSVLACVGILVVAPKLARFLQRRFSNLPKWLALGIAVSLAAQLLCFPVLLMLQSGFSSYSILANLLAEPMVVPVTVLGLCAVIASAVMPPLATLLSFVASIAAYPITALAHSISQWPLATGFWPSGFQGVMLAIALAAIVVALAVSKSAGLKKLLVSTLVLLLAIVASLGAVSTFRAVTWAKSGWFMVSCNVGQGDATVIRSQNQVAVIDVGRDPGMIDACLKQLKITHINLLELTHFDLDHVAGLTGALQGRQIDLAMLTPFVDARPGANDARAALEQRGIPVQLAETGLIGKLGDFDWQVLSPHRGGFEAADSNDGSITMLWRSQRVDIITLADLGEKGQNRLSEEASSWVDAQLASVPLIMKVSHHGSADQSPSLLKTLHPTLALISVGKGNSYGHPTVRTLTLLESIGAVIERTDQHGSISVALEPHGFGLGFQGEQGKTG